MPGPVSLGQEGRPQARRQGPRHQGLSQAARPARKSTWSSSPRPTTGTPRCASTPPSAGKDVYCEKPMTKTIDEAHAVVDAMGKNNRVMTVGVQSMADPTWRMAHEHDRQAARSATSPRPRPAITATRIVGQWRYYRLYKEMNPDDDRLGHVPGPQVRGDQGRAAGPEDCRSTAPCSASGAATGNSAAACSPTCSSIRRRT